MDHYIEVGTADAVAAFRFSSKYSLGAIFWLQIKLLSNINAASC